jgi:hypothetical protein
MKPRVPKKSPEEIVADTTEATARLTRELGLPTTAEIVATVTSISGTTSVTSTSWEERIEEIVEKRVAEIVKRILEDEKVLVALAGCAVPFKVGSIAISKSDPKVAEIKVEDKKEIADNDFITKLRNV